MKAMAFTDRLKLRLARRPVPVPQEGEVLIKVSVAGVTPTEKLWYTTSHHGDGTPRTNAIPGHEFSGVVAALGGPTAGYGVGDAVCGFNDWFAQGATAEFCITEPSRPEKKKKAFAGCCRRPKWIRHIQIRTI